MTACEEGRSTVTATRRSRSQGEATLAVRTASAQTCQPGALVSTVSAQKSPMAVQPPKPVGHLEHVVGTAPHRRGRADDDEQRQRDEAVGEHERGGRDARGMLRAGNGRHPGERAEPRRPGERGAGVDAADVVHLRDAPADPQRPGRRPATGEPEEDVEDVLLADEDGRGEVHDRQRRERRQRAAVVDQPVAAVEVVAEQPEVDQHHRDDQPVVGHEPRVLEHPPGGGREAMRARRRVLSRCSWVAMAPRRGERGPRRSLVQGAPHSSHDAASDAAFPTVPMRTAGASLSSATARPSRPAALAA